MLNETSSNYEAENLYILKLKFHSEHTYIMKLETMMKDIKLSQELHTDSEFKALKERIDIDFSFKIFTSGNIYES